MKRIFKYPFMVDDEVTILMPKDARILSAYSQGGDYFLCVWALVNPDNEVVSRLLHIRGTGHPADGLDEKPFLGTVHLFDGNLVYHVFDGGEIAQEAPPHAE